MKKAFLFQLAFTVAVGFSSAGLAEQGEHFQVPQGRPSSPNVPVIRIPSCDVPDESTYLVGPRSELLDSVVEDLEKQITPGIWNAQMVADAHYVATNLKLKYRLSYEEMQEILKRWNAKYQHNVKPAKSKGEYDAQLKESFEANWGDKIYATKKEALQKEISRLSNEQEGLQGESRKEFDRLATEITSAANKLKKLEAEKSAKDALFNPLPELLRSKEDQEDAARMNRIVRDLEEKSEALRREIFNNALKNLPKAGLEQHPDTDRSKNKTLKPAKRPDAQSNQIQPPVPRSRL